MSFLKFIVRAETSVDKHWAHDAVSAYAASSIRDKAIFVLEHAVLISYLDKVYGVDKLPRLIQALKQDIILKYLPDLKYAYFKHEKDARDATLNQTYLNILILLGMSSSKLDAKECMTVLKGSNSICTIDESFYTPYLLFIEKMHGLNNYTESDVIAANRSFNTGVKACIPSFAMSGKYLVVRYETAFPSYKLDYNKLKQVIQLGYTPDSIFSYWLGYNWAGMSISSVIGVLAAQCLEKDMNAITKGSNMLGYLSVYKSIIPLPSCIDQSKSLALSSEINTQKNRIVKFLCLIRETHNVQFDDKELLSRIMSSTEANDSNLLNQFLAMETARNVSVEMYNVFKSSIFGNFSELDVTLSGRTGRMNQSGSLSNAKKSKKTEDTDAQQEEEPADDPDISDADNTSKDTTDASVFDGPDSATKLENEDSSDNETPTEEPENDDTSNSGDLGNQPDEEPNEPAESDNTGNQGTTDNTLKKKLPALPKLDDKKGIRLSLSESESTSTVLYREELAAYIDSLLANPPSFLSVQSIAAIRKLKANWLYLLSVQDVHDFLAALIRVPKSLTIKK